MSKTQVNEIDRNIYDIKNKDDYEFKMQKGLSREIVEQISKRKNEPDWMLEIRLKALEMYEKLELPTWGPDLSELKMDEIATYVKPKTNLNSSWEDVPDEIKDTFDKLGIPEAEKTSLAGVGAQYDSEVVYHSMKEDLIKQGVIYTDMESAVRDYPEIVKEHFMKCVPISDHKFVALHAAVWSGGSFVYVPKGVKLDIPLQSYFRLNSPESGQFEHTLIIVDEGASLHFIEGTYRSVEPLSGHRRKENTSRRGTVAYASSGLLGRPEGCRGADEESERLAAMDFRLQRGQDSGG